MDEQNPKYDFCPKCGALTKDGVCQSCNYKGKLSLGKKRLQVGTMIVLTGSIFLGLISVAFFVGGVAITEVKSKLGAQTSENQERGFMPEFSSEKEEPLSAGEDPFLAEGYVSMWGSDHTNHTRDSFVGEYYESLCDSIDYEVKYGVDREYYEYISEEGNVTFKIAYIQLEGDIPNLDQLNQEIKDTTCYYLDSYFESYQADEEYQGYIEYYIDSYIPYNDNSKMSIVLDESWSVDGDSGFTLYGINIDLEKGSILPNDSMITITETLANEFRTISDAQNGTGITGLDNITDQELVDLLSDTTSNIIFYTPMGLEIGYNYMVTDYYGWVTVTWKKELE